MATEYLSIPQAAELLGISRIAVFKKVKSGRIPAIRIGRNWAVPADFRQAPPDAAGPAASKRRKPRPSALRRPEPPAPELSDRADAGPIPPRPVPAPAEKAAPAPADSEMDSMGWD